jgi:hypothetical protein
MLFGYCPLLMAREREKVMSEGLCSDWFVDHNIRSLLSAGRQLGKLSYGRSAIGLYFEGVYALICNLITRSIAARDPLLHAIHFCTRFLER